jgi:hypothetical protein
LKPYLPKQKLILFPHSWSAVVRGAVARGLESQTADLIYLRKCRRHYGTPASEPFSAFKHQEEDMYVDEHDGEKYAKGQMSWLITKGCALVSSQARHAEIELYRTFDAGESRVFKARLVACDDDVAPRRYADAVSCSSSWNGLCVQCC